MRGSAIYGLYRVYVGDVLGEWKRNWKLALEKKLEASSCMGVFKNQLPL